MKWALLVLALAVGALFGNAGHGDSPSPITALDGIPRLGVLLLLGVFLFGSLWWFGTAVGRYHASGDPKQVYRVDQETAARWRDDAGAESAPDTGKAERFLVPHFVGKPTRDRLN